MQFIALVSLKIGGRQMKNTVIIVPGLFGGIASKYYKPLAKMLGSDDFLLFRAGADWEPDEIADEIRQIEGAKKVVCLSCGAMIGNLLAGEKNTMVFYICPYIGADFINRNRTAYALRRFYRILASVAMAVSRPFMRHRWYPLFGGTKMDGWFLSTYAICKQLKYAFSKTPSISRVDGVIYSYGDKFVEPNVASAMSLNAVVARTASGEGPAHINLRHKGEKFGSTARADSAELSDDAVAYIAAFSQMLKRLR